MAIRRPPAGGVPACRRRLPGAGGAAAAAALAVARGPFWGAAAFCKDEGKAAVALLVIGATLATFWSLLRGGGWRAIGNLALLGLGLVPGVASLWLQYAYYPAPTRLIALMTTQPLTDTSRTAVIVRFLRTCLEDPACGWMWWGCGAGPLTLWPWLRRRELWLLWLFPAAQLAFIC